MIRGVAFDMDGLMFDTERLVAQVLLDIAREENLDIDMDLILACVGVNERASSALIKERLGEDFDTAALTRKRIDRVAEHLRRDGIPVKKGLRELLAYAKEAGYRMTVATSTSQEKARWYFQLAGIEEYFDEIISGDRVTHSKPHPEPFLRASELLGLEPSQVLVLEDSFHGIRSAHSAGCHPCMIPDLKQPDEEIAGLAEWIREDLTQVIDLLKEDQERFGESLMGETKKVRILCISDEVEPKLYERFDPKLVEGIDMILACGDLKPSYLEYLVTMVPVPLYYVRGNHDRGKPHPGGCEPLDGRLVTCKGVRIVGFDGCKSSAPFEYHLSERQMEKKVRKLYWTLRRSRGFDILVSHAGPAGLGDGPDEYHEGFSCLRRLIELHKPAFAVHGHTHMNYGRVDRVIRHGPTKVVNAFGYTVIECEAGVQEK